jgi:hypothetical protein
MQVRHIYPKVTINIGRGVEFSGNPKVLEYKVIDVILGMEWLCKGNRVIDYSKKVAKLTTSTAKILEYVADTLITNKASSNSIVLNQLEADST